MTAQTGVTTTPPLEAELNRLRAALRYKRVSFTEKVLTTTSCWWWLGAIGSHGYGVVSKRTLAHRVAWERQHGPIPGDLTVDHLCMNRQCVNPQHMELVTRAENGRRGSMHRHNRTAVA